MAAVEVPQNLEYKCGQLNAAPVLEVENFTNWKKRKAANLDQRLKSLIMSVLPDDQMNSVINCLAAKSAWDDLIPYHEGLSDAKESGVMDLKLCYNTFKFKEDSIYETEKNKYFVSATPLSTAFFSTSIVQDFQDSPDDKEDTRSSHEYLNDLEEVYQARAFLANSKRFLKKGTQRFSSAKATNQTEGHKCGKKGHFARDYWSKTSIISYQSHFQLKLLHSSEHKPEPMHTKDFEAMYNKVKAKLALLSSSTSAPNSSSGKNKGLIAEPNDWDEEEVSSNNNDVTEVKALMALADEERVYVGKESAKNGEWIMKKVYTLLEMEDIDDRKSFLDYLCIDLNYVEEQRNNLMSKHRNLVQEINTCKEQLLVLKQAKLDLFTMHYVNTEILKENQNLRNELKELTFITEAWLNSSNKVNHSGPKDPVFIKSSADNSEVSITGSNKPKLSEAEDSTLSNHDTSKLMNLQSVTPPSSTVEADWKREALQAKKVESFKASKTESSSALRSKTPTKSLGLQYPKCLGLDLKGYFYSNCAECNMDKKVFQMLVSCLKASLFVEFIPTQYQLADIFTKPLDEPTFNRLIVELACLSEATEQSHMSHSWICISMCGFVAFAGAQILVNSEAEQN
ncbi:hypothetical protein Tco_1057893 [Tanacetum coccineum]|uniref:Retrovirus-related Pol polyprotein from transposon TNT 1-94 n=1 Tax=Tanacetum coccineum TaxID=301880 RepID=A0ABQ5H6V8_9ASTR